VNETELIGLELEGWRALSTNGEEARAFYNGVLDQNVLMVLPGGMLLDDRAAILDSLSGQPWASFELEEPTALIPSPDVAMLGYGVVARRPRTSDYSALVSSTYVHRTEVDKLSPIQRRSPALLAVGVIAAVISMMVLAPAHARLKYPTCQALHHRFEHGVARSPAAARDQVARGYDMPAHGRHARNVYRANRTVLDHDNDGTVCEG
jgi:hypothetical protein